MQNYEQFWLENNKPKKKVVIKIKLKRQKPKVETPHKKIVVKKRSLIARSPENN